MRPTTHLTLLAGLYIHTVTAAYNLAQDFSGDKFFDGWDFYSGQDYTNGFVKYQSQRDAAAQGLISVQSNAYNQKQAFMGVDFTHKTPNGRPSVRLESKASIGPSLVIADFAHAPGGICGTWVAFWLVGSNWPNGGEVDIVEGVNDQTHNAMALHTKAGMEFDTTSASFAGSFSGKMMTNNCDVKAKNQPYNSGCSIHDTNANSYGPDFNTGGGGVYATQWTSDAIKIWFFPRDKIPQDIQAGRPVPGDSWGKPSASFEGKINEYFQEQKIILDTTFCGDWAGAVWDNSQCASKASTCNAYVKDNPGDFRDAYWLVNYIKVYQDDNSNPPPVSPSQSQPATTASSTATATEVATSAAPTSTPTKKPARTRTKTEVVTLTVAKPSSSAATASSQASTSSGRRTRTRTRTVTVAPLKATGTSQPGVLHVSRFTAPTRAGGAVIVKAKS